MQTIHIQSYNMVDFLIEVEKNIKNGYTFDFVSIGNFPQLVGGTFIAGMILDEDQGSEKQLKQEVVVKVELDTTAAQEILDQDIELVNTAQNPQQEIGDKIVTEGTQEQVQKVVEAPKKAGRPAKAK